MRRLMGLMILCRWLDAMMDGVGVDQIYGHWLPFCGALVDHGRVVYMMIEEAADGA